MKLKKYLTLTRAGIIEALQFRLSFVVMVIGNLLYLIVVYFLWKAIYASAGTDVVNGMTFTDTLIYLVLATALFNFMEMYTVWEIGRNIQSGKIVLDLLKPMEYRKYLFWSYSGSFVTQFFLTFLPTFIAVAVVTHGAIPMGINLLFFVVSVIMAVSINYSIDFIVGTICLYTESIWGINIMKQVIVLLLSGATIPLAFFPDKLRDVVELLPFAAVYDVPLKFLLWDGISMEPHEPWCMLGFQLFWCIVMLVISKVFWKFSLRQITVNGG
ncbi:ABC-2 family transporter protein [Ruminococcus flavefaciens]|uniref:ABC transporter permease n=1 Tax=Ruminococcus flavefaciens TaxID=1265 RepID=UPI0015684077|nr:ABC-2 family transporter protein [Ruminococcus flavefaciens]